MPDLRHQSLDATFKGINLETCVQYRGIPYGNVKERFAEPTIISDWKGEQVNCRKWGPRCPQVKYDVGYLSRTPEHDVFYDNSEDEFKCLNLDVTVPLDTPTDANLPVMIWIHGGSQIISYGNGASKIGDTTRLVAESAQHSRPIIVVSVQYRLNMFHVGDGNSTHSLGFKDQQVAMEWVHRYIAGFGGDPENITLVGESAGAVFVHGLIVSKTPVRRGVLMSGSLYLSPPQPTIKAKAMLIDPVLRKVQEKGYESLKEAPVQTLLDVQAEIPVRSVFIQEAACLKDWQKETGSIQELMIGDCEFEAILWKSGIEAMTASQIVECFDKAGASADKLKELYHINESRPAQCRHGALDFMNDKCFAVPVQAIADVFQQSGKQVYRYIFDQTNPWQQSSRAHHAVDLIYLFGGFDLSMNPSAEELGREMRKRFIWFMHGEAPWTAQKTFAFGPLGDTKEIDDRGVAARRRVRQMEGLKELDAGDVAIAFGSLHAGRVSLHN